MVNLTGDYLTRGGKISRYGTVHYLDQSVSEDHTRDEGALCFAEPLLRYGNREGYTARVSSQGGLEVLKGKRIVAKIPPSCLREVDNTDFDTHLVLDNGWIGIRGDRRAYGQTLQACYMGALQPKARDLSDFIKVNGRFAGGRAIVLEFHDGNPNLVLINSKVVPHEIHYPLRGKFVSTTIGG